MVDYYGGFSGLEGRKNWVLWTPSQSNTKYQGVEWKEWKTNLDKFIALEVSPGVEKLDR
jgi:hypothetical protein